MWARSRDVGQVLAACGSGGVTGEGVGPATGEGVGPATGEGVGPATGEGPGPGGSSESRCLSPLESG